MVAFESFLQGKLNLHYELEFITVALGEFLKELPCWAFVHWINGAIADVHGYF